MWATSREKHSHLMPRTGRAASTPSTSRLFSFSCIVFVVCFGVSEKDGKKSPNRTLTLLAGIAGQREQEIRQSVEIDMHFRMIQKSGFPHGYGATFGPAHHGPGQVNDRAH